MSPTETRSFCSASFSAFTSCCKLRSRLIALSCFSSFSSSDNDQCENFEPLLHPCNTSSLLSATLVSESPPTPPTSCAFAFDAFDFWANFWKYDGVKMRSRIRRLRSESSRQTTVSKLTRSFDVTALVKAWLSMAFSNASDFERRRRCISLTVFLKAHVVALLFAVDTQKSVMVLISSWSRLPLGRISFSLSFSLAFEIACPPPWS